MAAVVLMCEAVGIGLLNWFLGLVVDEQEMSLAGLEPRTMTLSTWVAGVLFGGYLLLCAVFLLRMAIRDRAPGSFPRLLLISCAVVHGLLGAFSVGLVGWLAFLTMMLVLALLVLPLVAYGEDGPRGRRPRSGPSPEPAGSEDADGAAGPPSAAPPSGGAAPA